MTAPTPLLQRLVGLLVVLLGVLAVAAAGTAAGADDTPTHLADVDDDDPPEPTEPPSAPATIAPPEPPEQAPDEGPVSTVTFSTPCRSDLDPGGVVAYSIKNHGATRTYVVTLKESSGSFGAEERSKTHRNIADGGSVGAGFTGVADGSYSLEAIADGLDPFRFSVTVDCSTPRPTTEPTSTEPATTVPETTAPETTVAEAESSGSAPETDAAAIPAESDAATGSQVLLFADPATPVGESTLVRTDDAVLATFWIGSRPPAEAITLWWVVFNDPDSCSPPACGEDDLFVGGDPTQGPNEDQVAAAGIVVGYAGGTIVAEDGTALMVARLDQGHPGADVIVGDDADGLLTDAAGAEVHLVARSHGPAIAGMEAVQITSYDGGCDTFLDPPAAPADAGECVDVAFAVHQP